MAYAITHCHTGFTFITLIFAACPASIASAYLDPLLGEKRRSNRRSNIRQSLDTRRKSHFLLVSTVLLSWETLLLRI